MDGNDRANANTNSNNGGGEDNKYISNYWCSPSTIESAGEAALQFPSTIPVAAIPHSSSNTNTITDYPTMSQSSNIHTTRIADPHPYSKSHATTTATKYNVAQQSKKGAFDPDSIVLEDLQIGNTHTAPSAVGTKAGGAVGPSLTLPLPTPTILPALERRASPTQQYYGKRSTTGRGIGGKGSSSHSNSNYDYNNYHINPQRRITNKHKYKHEHEQEHEHEYRQQQKQPWEEEHQQLNYVSPIEKHNNAKKKPPPNASSSLQTLNQQQQELSQHRSRDLKLPPPSSPPLSKQQARQQTTKNQYIIFGARNNNNNDRSLSRPAQTPSVPRAIDVDMSYSNRSYFYDKTTNDGGTSSNNHHHNHHSALAPAPAPPLSPISFSSSMFLKRAPIGSSTTSNDDYLLYPSKDAIEQQLSEYDLPPYPIDAVFPTNPVAAASTANITTANATTANSNIATANATTRSTANATSANLTSTITSSSKTALFSEGNTTNALNTTAVFKNRPEKPMRINSHFPSQLQLQKQRQQELQQQNQQQLQQNQHQHQQHQHQQQHQQHQQHQHQQHQQQHQQHQHQQQQQYQQHQQHQQQHRQHQHQQQQHQQHQHQHQQHQHQQQQQHQHTSTHRPPEIDDTQHSVPSPCPLPIGNGITNGIATGIDATTAANRRQRQRAFVPLTHNYQEFDLQLSSPATTTTTISSTPRSIRDPQTPTNQQQQPQFQASNNAPGVIRDSTIENDSSQSSKSSHSLTVVKVEIYPGVSKILRGAHATAKAAKRNFVVGCTCLVCTAEYSCIADAAFVICPACYVVNPLEGPVTVKIRNNYSYNDTNTNITAGGGRNIERWGVGLGFVSDSDRGEKYISRR